MCTPATVSDGNKIITLVKCLSFGEGIGLFVTAESGLLSLAAVLFIFVLIIRNILRKVRHPPPPPATWHLIQVPADLFMLALFTADLIQAIGGAMNFKWIHHENVHTGHFCTAQGAMQQLGETIVAFIALVIALHTFSTVWWSKGVQSLLSAAIIVGIIWLFVLLYVAIAVGLNASKLYITPTPYWCWIGPHYMIEKISGQYLWFWLTLGVSLLLYVPLFFWSRGNITVDQDKWWKFYVHRSTDSSGQSERRRHSLHLIAYPIIYSVIIIPLSVVRWIEFGQENTGETHIAPGWILAVESIFHLGGFFDVSLFLLTRRDLLLFGNSETPLEAIAELNGVPLLSLEQTTDWDLPHASES